MTSNTFLRFVAIVCIANSHLDALYPLPLLATGGSIGNALFFMLSGYGLFLSANIQDKPFLPWYKRRILRIYPSTWLATILLIVIAQSAWRTLGFFDYAGLFVWPTAYWFISALMIYYVIYFIVLKRQNYKYFLAGIFVLVLPYLYYYLTFVDLSGYSIEGPGYFKWIFYLQTMFFGAYLAGSARSCQPNFLKDGLALVFLIALYYGILFFMSKFGGWQFQAVTHVLMFPVLFFFLRFAESKEITALVQARYVGTVISLMAALTLEIYLLHGYVRSFPFVLKTIFPLNIVVFWVVTVSLSYGLYRASGLMMKAIGGRTAES
jgi:peptidoglycan/LPS O-acetylase OafA/YrhL